MRLENLNMKSFLVVFFIIGGQTLFGLTSSQNCEDAKRGNCEVMKALCFKGVKVNETLIEIMCPKTCDACDKLQSSASLKDVLKSNRALIKNVPLNVTTNSTLLSNQTLNQKKFVGNASSGLTFSLSFGLLVLLSLVNNL